MDIGDCNTSINSSNIILKRFRFAGNLWPHSEDEGLLGRSR